MTGLEGHFIRGYGMVAPDLRRRNLPCFSSHVSPLKQILIFTALAIDSIKISAFLYLFPCFLSLAHLLKSGSIIMPGEPTSRPLLTKI